MLVSLVYRSEVIIIIIIVDEEMSSAVRTSEWFGCVVPAASWR